MEWLLIPGIGLALSVIVVGIAICACGGDFFPATMAAVVMGFCLLFALIIPCVEYYESKGESLKALNFYHQFVMPNVTAEGDDWVEISNPEAAWWQAGDYSLSGYNAWLTSTRYTDTWFILGSAVYTPPEELKFVRVK